MEFNMEEIVKEEKRQYQREWRAQNKDRVREINQRYWANRVRRKLEAQASQGEEGAAE